MLVHIKLNHYCMYHEVSDTTRIMSDFFLLKRNAIVVPQKNLVNGALKRKLST